MTAKDKEKLYTLRWFLNHKWGQPDAREDALEIISGLLGEKVAEQREGTALTGGQKLLWYPLAETDFAEARTRGSYKMGYPKGAVVHFTAGRRNGLKNGINVQRHTGMCYFLIDEEGAVSQNFPLDEWGYHAGKSSWSGLPGSVSDELVGIEVMCGGRLKKEGSQWQTWYGEVIPASGRRTVTAKENMIAGTYQKFTQAQEDALAALLLWLHRNNPGVFSLDLVLGHDEVSPGRKNDPGGSLSTTMPDLRKKLKGA